MHREMARELVGHSVAVLLERAADIRVYDQCRLNAGGARLVRADVDDRLERLECSQTIPTKNARPIADRAEGISGWDGFPRRCPCPGSVPWSAAGWLLRAVWHHVVHLALAKSRWVFAAL